MTIYDKYSPSEQKLRNLLGDGQSHSSQELKLALGDSLMEDGTLYTHICNLRTKMKRLESGLLITTESARGYAEHNGLRFYRLRRAIQQD